MRRILLTTIIILGGIIIAFLSPFCALRVQLCQNRVGDTAELIPSCAYPYPADLDQSISHIKGLMVHRSPTRDLPSELLWQDGLQEPDIGDPHAIKGGTIHIHNAGPFPLHFRPFGGLDLSFFNYTLYKSIEMKLVAQHPSTGHVIPALAEAWAVEGRKVYFRINPKARYSNGRPVRAGDFIFGIYLRTSPHAQDSFALSALSNQLEAVESIGDDILCVTLNKATLLAPLLASELLHADEPSFYAEFGADFLTRYSKRVAPTTGGYTLYPQGVQRGRSIKLSRVKTWWAKKLRYYHHSCNVDHIEINFLSDEAQLWEFFLNKRIDFIQSRNVSTWQQRTECPAVWQGLIEKRVFIADYPLPSYGIYLNAATIPQLELRRGIIAALDMDRAMGIIFHGEAERLACFSDGYNGISPKGIPAFPYNPTKARAHFQKAGYTKIDPDGILAKHDGERLSYTLIYTPSDKTDSLARILTEQAKKCGFELKTQALPWQKCAAAVEGKQYHLAFWADVAPYPLPRLAQLFHSDFVSTHGLNLHSIADPKLDQAIESMEAATDMDQFIQATKAANLRIAELAIWLPGWKENTAYIANWRHLRFPHCENCTFALPQPYEVLEAHLYWIDPSYATQGTYPEVDQRIQSKNH